VSRLGRPVSRRALHIVVGLLASVAALALAGCGHEKVTVAETEGVYLDLGPMKYQVQVSRWLNPTDPQDFEFFRGLPAGVSPALPADELWFGIFLRVENPTDRPEPMADRFEIVDTQGAKYEPLALDQKTNPLVYRPGFDLPPKSIFPMRDTLGDQSFAQGGLLLFQIKTASNQNRPLVLHISNIQGSFEGEVDLDV
jgi:hypothetical protein